ncbi:hypothetical protein L1887_59131 [Cichorium endivia]|nr:hypothetical protein L1887_59131 [Cichorium endivia]
MMCQQAAAAAAAAAAARPEHGGRPAGLPATGGSLQRRWWLGRRSRICKRSLRFASRPLRGGGRHYSRRICASPHHHHRSAREERDRAVQVTHPAKTCLQNSTAPVESERHPPFPRHRRQHSTRTGHSARPGHSAARSPTVSRQQFWAPAPRQHPHHGVAAAEPRRAEDGLEGEGRACAVRRPERNGVSPMPFPRGGRFAGLVSLASAAAAAALLAYGAERCWGKSQSYLARDGKNARFYGTLDIKTLGGAGFASQRTAAEHETWDLSDYAGIQLDVAKGDKKRYTLILKDTLLTRNPDNGREQATISWECDFELPPQTVPGETRDRSVFIPWSSLNPTYRGKLKKDAKPIDLKSVKSFFGTQEGDFSLTIKSIKAVSRAPSSAGVQTVDADLSKLEKGSLGQSLGTEGDGAKANDRVTADAPVVLFAIRVGGDSVRIDHLVFRGPTDVALDRELRGGVTRVRVGVNVVQISTILEAQLLYYCSQPPLMVVGQLWRQPFQLTKATE